MKKILLPILLVLGLAIGLTGHLWAATLSLSGTQTLSFAGVWDTTLWDGPAGVFTAGTYAWTVYGTNTIANDANSLKVTYVDNTQGAYAYLSDAHDLSADLVVGDRYKLQVDAKKNAGGDAFNIIITGGGLSAQAQAVTGTTFDTYTFYFTATHATNIAVRFGDMSAGEIGWVDNLVLQRQKAGLSFK